MADEIRRSPVDIVVDDLERIKDDTNSSFDAGCLAGAVDLIKELAAERDALRAALADLTDDYPAFSALRSALQDNSSSPVEGGQ
jgi:hypothetical protein